MSNLRAICRPHAVFASMACCYRSMGRVSSLEKHSRSLGRPPPPPPRYIAVWFDRLGEQRPYEPRVRQNRQRRMVATKASNWTDSKSPYETLELEKDANEEQIKVAYRRLAKFYHPDVYNGRGTLEEDETAETRFIKIQAAYELLIDEEKRRQYDTDNRVNPMKASEAWIEWILKKRKAFDQRGDMAIAAWAEQQQLELHLRVRRLARSKIDPEEERKILVREKKASIEQFNNTLRRHTLILKKRDLNRRKAEEEKKRLIGQLLAEEGLELDNDEDK
ncbi:uncharacterized J domain-containing protein C4H3.01 [Salvia hispanica]|uniref:uncharacterized J domain-containing protein C4H3.01 n=1 Tax=Salvia hispanica TaxID=49212 RepID=UPI002009653A|nr:uncharacterized J domain-containing protein C4H3.01 [Salvia hispanica]